MDTWSKLREYAEKFRIPPEALPELERRYREMAAVPGDVAQFDAMRLEILSGNAQNVDPEREFGLFPGRLTGTLLAISLYPEIEEFYAKENLPDSMLEDIASDLGLWVRHELDDLGYPGLSLRCFYWCCGYWSGRVKQFGRLQCETEYVFSPEIALFRSPDGGLQVNPFAAGGNRPADAEAACGDRVINLHIPASGPLLRDACVSSLRLMAKFMESRRPGVNWKGFVCFSWLLDPVFNRLLRSDSHILEFQRLGRCFPLADDATEATIWRVFGSRAVESGVDAVEIRTGMQRCLAPYLKSGGKIRESCLFIGRNEINRL